MSSSGQHAWEPFWLGPDARRRYAALHPARHAQRGFGVLIAPPLLHEQPRSRRLMTEMANRFAELGMCCLRFDYFGSGDSDGEGGHMTVASMRDDLDIAARRLRAEAGVDRLALLAVRGGTFAVDAWIKAGGRADHVVLWEPILDGAAWLEELEHDDAHELRSPDRYPLQRGAPVAGDDSQLMGFDVGMRLRRDLAAAQVARRG